MTYFNIKKLFFISIVFILVAFSIFKITQYVHNKNYKIDLNLLISSGLDFYSPSVVKNLRIDSYMMLKRVIKYTKNDNKFLDDSVYDNDPFVRWLNKEKQYTNLNTLLEEIYPVVKDLNNKEALLEPRSGVMLKALYCDVVGYTDLDFALLKLSHQKDGSYDDTHFLLGLLFLKKNGCYTPSVVEKSIKEVVGNIVYAENNDKFFSDLYAERIVFLYWAGYGQYVKERWISLVKNSFAPDLGWKAYNTDIYSHPHSTGLALMSLIYYIEGKFEQDFY